MGEPALDLSEIVDLYKEDARLMIVKMREALTRWDDAAEAAAARQELRRMSHQLRGSGRTYGFRSVTRVAKAMESIMLKVEKNVLPADERAREALRVKVERLASEFSATVASADPPGLSGGKA